MKEKELCRSSVQKIILRPTYYLLHFSRDVVVTTKNSATTLFPFIVNYLQVKESVVR